MTYKSPPGVFDILPNFPKESWQQTALWQYAEKIMKKTAEHFGYLEIRTPSFEKLELFQRSVGTETDIVSKEMYTFEDRGNRMLSLRPEGTAPVIRAYVEHNLANHLSQQKLYYIGPMYRYERMQAGRYRQFHQFGVEAIGSKTPEQDAELIDFTHTLYQRLGLKNCEIQISSLGSHACRDAYKAALKNYLSNHLEKLSSDSQRRFETNLMRVLDSKDPGDREILKNAPNILDYLSDQSKHHFEEVLKLLDALKIPFKINTEIVRGLDYYNDTVFEVVSSDLGAQNSIGGGGRYDTLIKELGGPPTPAIGFATGIERVLQAMLAQKVPFKQAEGPTLFMIPLGTEAKERCFSLIHQLRTQGISAEMDVSGRKLGKVMQFANTINARFIAVVGDEELKTKTFKIKEMETGEEIVVPIDSLQRILEIATNENAYMQLWDIINRPFLNQEEADFFINRLGGSIQQTTELMERLKKAVETMKEIL